MNKLIVGKGGISAEVVADSVNAFGDRLTTLKLHYHRFIHAEFLRHRMLSHSVSSSRAIPTDKFISQINEFPATPIYWGKNKPGMVADSELKDLDIVKTTWNTAKENACECASIFVMENCHKQISNRILEPFQFINQVVTATDYFNFFHLRLHEDAQPEIRELARVMREAMTYSCPVERRDTYHLPFIDDEILERENNIDNCIKISASVCAQSSYRTADYSLDVANRIYDKLVTSKPVHASPFEHIALPFSESEMIIRKKAWMLFSDNGLDAKQTLYSRNFRGWEQYRTTIKDDTFTPYRTE